MEGWQAEIRDLHRFFEDWYNGLVPDTDEIFDRLTVVLDPTFVLVGPDGILRKRSEVVHGVYRQYGGKPVRIWIERPELVAEFGEWCVVRYSEWHAPEREPRKGRIAMAVLRRNSAAPHGWSWVTLQETWLPH